MDITLVTLKAQLEEEQHRRRMLPLMPFDPIPVLLALVTYMISKEARDDPSTR